MTFYRAHQQHLPAGKDYRNGRSKEFNGELCQQSIAFPREMFDRLKALAIEQRTSFAEQVRIRVQWGLDLTEEDE